MSKKIDAALKDLKKALDHHADTVSGRSVSLKKVQRASAKLVEAIEAYASVVVEKTGTPSPFLASHVPGLEEATMVSLAAERDALVKAHTGSIPKQSA